MSLDEKSHEVKKHAKNAQVQGRVTVLSFSKICESSVKVNEEWGGLSNMSNDFPLRVNGLRIGSSEALYQACRFPHQPDWQREILDAPHAMQAKMKAKKGGRRKDHSRPDWEEVQVETMRWCLRVKLAQHLKKFGGLLRWSVPRPIVEQSRKDRFWGAVLDRDGVLRGENRLGRLLMELREELLACKQPGEDSRLLRVEPPQRFRNSCSSASR